MSASSDIVITGIGVVSPIGVDVDSFWQALLNRTSGVSVRPEFVNTDLPIRVAAQVRDFDPKLLIKPRKAIKIMCQPIQFGVAAAAMAVEQAGLEAAAVDPDRIGTLFGAETFFADPLEVADVFRNCIVDRDYQHDRWGEFAMRKIQPLWMLKYLPNMAASHISIALDARGHSNTICQGEASGLIALIEAATVIQRGMCDVVITGGTGSIAELTSMLYRGNDLSTHFNDRPESASRPFERDRDGMVAGEGAGAIVLESAAHAAARGAVPLAKIAGWSRRFGQPTATNLHETIQSGFENALEVSGKRIHDIGAINASAAGFKKLDAAEGKAINKLFPDFPVVAHKSNFGNLGPGTSTVELIAAIQSLQHGIIPGTLNYDHPDPACPVNVSRESVELKSGTSILKSSVSTTGQFASLILDKA